MTVYVVMDVRRLVPVQRDTEEVAVPEALALLAAGPTKLEQQAGLRTALPPRPFVMGKDGLPRTDHDGNVAIVDVTDDFTSTKGRAQVLATAQIVWTVTSLGTADYVRFAHRGAAVEMPTDSGVAGGPVQRSDYDSMSPADPATPRAAP